MIATLPEPLARATRVAGPAVAVLAAQALFYPLEGAYGLYLQGALLGLYGALIALGMALVYRANRTLNFAQADLGLVPASLAVLLVVHSGLNYVASLAIGLGAALALGALVELVVIRRFFDSPRLIVTVATIGLSQLLTLVAFVLPNLWGETPRTLVFDVPGNVSFDLGTARYETDDILALVLAPAMMVALAVFLRRSRTGMAVRASAERADRAALLGIPVKRIELVVWMVATTLSFVGVVLKSGSFGLPLVQPGVSLSILLSALAALMLGRLTDLPAVALSAIALGVLEQGVDWGHGRIPFTPWDLPNDQVLVAPVLGLVIVVALLVQRSGTSRADRDPTSSWQATAEVRPTPRELRRVPEVRAGRAVAALAAVAAAIAPGFLLGPGDGFEATGMVVFAIVIASVVVLTGWAGQVSLGQLGFASVGGGVTALALSEWGLDLAFALVVAGVAGAAVAVVVGLPALRLRGLYLAVTSLSFALAASSYFLNPSFFDWIPRERMVRPHLFGRIDLEDQGAMYLTSVAVLAVVLLAVRGVRRSRTGRVLVAVRENEAASQAVGVSVVRAKLVAFATSGAIAAVGGGLLVVNERAFDAGVFAPAENLAVFTAGVVGGLGSLTGAVLGAVFLRGSGWIFDDQRLQLLTTSVGVLVVLLVIPGGIGQVVFSLRDRVLRGVATRRGIVVPSLVADVATEGEAEAHVVEHAAEVATHEAVAHRAEVPVDVHGPGDGLLEVRGLDVAYGRVQILFGVDLTVADGEVLALLGTNGAGKSTLLRAICGLVGHQAGTVRFAGRDLGGMPAHEIAALGIAQVPGGQGVFPSLTVAENLAVACWLVPAAERAARTDEVLGQFPVLRERLDHPAANLSGGQQQMLALGMAFLARPRLLVIDELSLGLAPAVVEQLLEVVRAMAEAGTTIVLVEQSVNVALTVATSAVFMEKGEVRFRGPTADLLARPDVLRSVYLEGAGAGLGERTSIASRPAGGQVAAPSATPALAAHGLTVAFGGIRAVGDVDLTLARGEVLGVIGPNGAGKTTLFDLISGFTRADHGRVHLDGVDVTERSPAGRAALGLGRSFQDARLFPSLTVEETIAVALDRWVDVTDPLNAALRMPANFESERAVRQWVDELVDLLGIGAFRTKFVRELSTGSRRIVDLACVLAHRPSVVLLDEPSSGIAQRETEALGPLLLQIRDHLDASLLVIEHDMPLLTSVADRLVALDQGSVVTTGPAADVLHHPVVVASYLGGDRDVIARSGTAAPQPA